MLFRSRQLLADLVAPAAPPAPRLAAASDAGNSALDGVTNRTTGLTVEGSGAEPSATVLLYDQGTLIAQTTGSGTGSYQFDNLSLTAGGHVLTVRARDAAGNTGATSTPFALTVDTVRPVVQELATPDAATYQRTQKLAFTLRGSEALYVTGIPGLELQLDSGPVIARYVSGSGSNALVFEYQVVAGDRDANGVQVTGLQGTILDLAGNDLVPTLLNVGQLSGVKVDSSVTGAAADGYLIDVVIFSDANNNGRIDVNEAVGGSVAPGVFALPGGKGPLVMRGGEDISTGLPFEVQYKAPEAYSVISPVSTLVEEARGWDDLPAAYARSIEEAETRVQGAGLFGTLTVPAVSLATYDPFREASAKIGRAHV